MSLISRTISNFIQGVSQQPSAVRRETQNESELNVLASAVDGAKKRPPVEVLATYSPQTAQKPFVHWHERSSSLRYAVVIQGNQLYAINADTGVTMQQIALGMGHPLRAPSFGDVSDLYAAVSVGDKTFIARKANTVAIRSDLSADRPFEAVINVKAGNFSRRYIVTVNGSDQIIYLTPNGEDETHNDDIGTEVIAYILVNGVKPSWLGTQPASANITGAGLAALSGFTVTLEGSTIYLSSATDFTITTEDGQGEGGMTVVKGSVQNFSDLPATVPVADFVIKVEGQTTNTFDDYYVTYDRADKVWREALKPATHLGFDPDTMPFILTHNSDDSFTLDAGSWTDRTAGSEDSAKDPEFVEQSIVGLSYMQGRLGIHAAETIYYSKTADVFVFWPETVTQVLPDAPFGIQSTGSSVTDWQHFIEMSDRSLIFSDAAQGAVTPGSNFTPTSTKLTVSTQYEAVGRVRPVVIGDELFFVVKRGEFNGLYKLQIVSNSDTLTGEDMTEHVPKFIPQGAYALAASKTEKTLALATDGDPSALYVWRFILNGGERLQSAWTRWSIEGATIHSVEFFGTRLSVAYATASGSYFGQIDISPSKTDAGQEWLTLLDYRITDANCIIAYDGLTDQTTITHYDTTLDGIDIVSRLDVDDDDAIIGELAEVVSRAPGQVVVQGDWSARPFFAGVVYDWRMELTKLFYRDKDGAAVEEARCQVRYLRVYFAKTGYLQVTWTPLGRSAYTRTFEGRVYDNPGNTFDDVSLEDGVLSVPVMSDGTTTPIIIHNNSHLSNAITKAQWKGSFNPRARILAS